MKSSNSFSLYFRIDDKAQSTDSVQRYPIFHIPHDGNWMPDELMTSVCIPQSRFMEYHEQMRDLAVGALVPDPYRNSSHTEHFEISRLLCDVERFIGSEEIMEQYGMGFCYEHAFDGMQIKKVTENIKAVTLSYYQQHHDRMDYLCSKHPQILLFDMHSYWDGIVPADFIIANRPTPDVCVGTDPVFTPSELSSIVCQLFEDAGFSVELNYPYSGCFVPNAALKGEGNCVSIMLEFHRRAYLNMDNSANEQKILLIRNTLEQIAADCVKQD